MADGDGRKQLGKEKARKLMGAARALVDLDVDMSDIIKSIEGLGASAPVAALGATRAMFERASEKAKEDPVNADEYFRKAYSSAVEAADACGCAEVPTIGGDAADDMLPQGCAAADTQVPVAVGDGVPISAARTVQQTVELQGLSMRKASLALGKAESYVAKIAYGNRDVKLSTLLNVCDVVGAELYVKADGEYHRVFSEG